LADQFAGFLAPLFPGLSWDCNAKERLAEALSAVLPVRPDIFVVYRDDIPLGESPSRALADGFGAEAGDEVVEVRPGGRPGEVVAQRWAISPVDIR
jgi:hypothetical protein